MAITILYMEKYKKSYKNSKFKISAPTWNEEFEFLDGSYSKPDLRDDVGYKLRKHGEKQLILQWKYT